MTTSVKQLGTDAPGWGLHSSALSPRHSSLTIEGGIFPSDLLDRLASGEGADQSPASFGLPKGARLSDELQAAFTDLRTLWDAFQVRRARSHESLTSLTRNAWVIPYLERLGFELDFQRAAVEAGGQSYAFSHRAGEASDAPPIHIVAIDQELNRKAPGAARSPHALVQEYLNRSDALWGIVTNGKELRLLRDSERIAHPAYVAFDLEGMLAGNLYSEFILLYRLIQRSRFAADGANPDDCVLERLYQEGIEQGGRVRDHLRDGVEKALIELGSAFLAHPESEDLRNSIASGALDAPDYYRQLLRLVYRLLFLFVAEERGLVYPPDESLAAQQVYAKYYALGRLRERCERYFAGDRFSDLWLGLLRTFQIFRDDEAARSLGLRALDSELFGITACNDLEAAGCENAALLRAISHLSLFTDEHGVRRRVNYAALDVEELGSIYESLLDFHPRIEPDTNGRTSFDLVAGSERKQTGSYYTPKSLVHELIESALVPVLQERLRAARTTEERRQAILGLRVCDPASGSGHFLLAAARRLARELAQVETGEAEPSPDAYRAALRQVIRECLYAVDKNPLAVDLCKVALWIEGHNAGVALGFLDQHIRCGDSLVGVLDPDVVGWLKRGIPDGAYTAVTGDDKKAAASLKKRNKQERQLSEQGQRQSGMRFDGEVDDVTLADVAPDFATLGGFDDRTPADVATKQLFYEELRAPGTPWHQLKTACDLWTAAFFVPLQPADYLEQEIVPTSDTIRRYLLNPKDVEQHQPQLLARATGLATELGFFHWPLEFPEVFIDGGFDVVLGNPPWEKFTLSEEEWFASRAPVISRAKGKATRAKLIEALAAEDPGLYSSWESALRSASLYQTALSKKSDLYPLTGTGELNTYHLFAERSNQFVARSGRVGLVVKSGIVSADNCLPLFRILVEQHQLVSLFDFVNTKKLFPAVQTVERFALLTFSGRAGQSGEFSVATVCQDVSDLKEAHRIYSLTSTDIHLMSPLNGACPLLKSDRDHEIMRQVYHAFPILAFDNKSSPERSWGLRYVAEFHTANDSEHLKQLEQLEALGGVMDEHRHFQIGDEEYLPLYEGKYVFLMDHRYGSFEGVPRAKRFGRKASAPTPPDDCLHDPAYAIIPRYWLPKSLWLERARMKDLRIDYQFHFRDVAGAYPDLRTAIGAICPALPSGHKLPALVLDGTGDSRQDALRYLSFSAVFCSLPFDYLVRNKLFSKDLTLNTLSQIPMPTPQSVVLGYGDDPVGLRAHLAMVALELSFTTWSLSQLGLAIGYTRPFAWDRGRRFRLLREIDAAAAHFYGLSREQFAHVLSTFQTLSAAEMKVHRSFRTRDLALAIYDAMADALRSGQPYQTRLDPPPADPQVAHTEMGEVRNMAVRFGIG